MLKYYGNNASASILIDATMVNEFEHKGLVILNI